MRISLGIGLGIAQQGGGGNPILSLFADGTQGFWYNAKAGFVFQDTGGTTPATVAGDAVARANDQSGRGNNAAQATGAAQPRLQFDGALPAMRFDGADDTEGTALLPGTSMTYFMKTKPTGVKNRVLMGSRVSSNFSYVGYNTAGQASAGVGTQALNTICGGPDITDLVSVIGVSFDGVNVLLSLNGAQIYSQPQVGVAPTTASVLLGGYNFAGVPGQFSAQDIYHAVAVKKATTIAQHAAASAYLMVN